MKRRVAFTALFMVVISVFDVTARAGFIDDWLQQKTETSPGYFEGEKRGYATGGSISARWGMTNDHLFSVEPPRFKVGCGGIDLFMGGFSFLNVNYLVQKFEKILQAAPAMAFDLALSTLCQQCSNIMKGLEALANDLNHLQMNECHDAKVLAAQIVSPFTDNPKIEAEAQQNYSLVTGIQNMYTDIQKQVLSNNGQPTLSNESGMYSGCPADIVNLFMTQGQSVFSAVAANRGIPTSHVELVRGLIGDLQFDPITDSSGNTTFHLTQVIPCQENSAYGLDSLLDGSAYARPLSAPDATCVPISDTNANLTQWAQNRVDSVYQNLLTQGTLSSDDQAFINTVPLVYHNLLYAVATKQGPEVEFDLAQFAARAYALSLVKDLYTEAMYNIRLAQTALKKQANSPKSDCQISSITLDAGYLKDLDSRIRQIVSILQEDYKKYLAEHEALFAVSQRYADFMSLSRDKLSKSYSKSFVNRVLGKM
jgi:conjugative transfer pilus assembly protein TraH